MPELPEVEVVRRGLEPAVTGRRIDGVQVLHPRPVRRHAAGPDDFAASLTGRTFGVPRRRGKFLWLPFDDGDALLAHLGMSGQFRLDAPGAPLQRHARVLLDLADGVQLRFVDQRTFGRWLHTPTVDGIPAPVTHIALDPLEAGFDPVAVARRIRTKKSPIKSVLLDQTVVSGIGNIYADEALWEAGILPTRRAASLRQRDVVTLLAAAANVMRRALAAGGTSFDALYVNVNGASGYFSRSLNAYGQEGRPCPRCGTPIRRVAFQNRSTHFCPACQTI